MRGHFSVRVQADRGSSSTNQRGHLLTPKPLGLLACVIAATLLAACGGQPPPDGGTLNTVDSLTPTQSENADNQGRRSDPNTASPAQRARPAGVLARSITLRGVALLVPLRLSEEAAGDAGQLPETTRAALRQSGLLGVVIDESRAEALVTGLVSGASTTPTAQANKRDALSNPSPASVAGLVATVVSAGQSWSMLHAGARSVSPWPLVLESGAAVVQPAGQLRLLARCWLVPGEASQDGGLSGEVTLDVVPYLAGASGRAASAGTMSLEPARLSRLADRGTALEAQRITVVLPRGRALVLAPIAMERDAPLGQDQALKPGEVARRNPSTPAPAETAASRPEPAKGPSSQPPLSLGEALLSDATPAATARAATLIVLTAQGTGRFDLLPR